jgi:ADP-dependent NAD(P)H-hydrate dehydratase
MTIPRFSIRDQDSHKGTYGRALIIAGRRGMAGAAILAGRAALRCGAGLVTVATPDNALDTVAAGDPCYTTLPLVTTRSGELSLDSAATIKARTSTFDAIAVGPGMGVSDSTYKFVGMLITRTTLPLVIDADGLSGLGKRSLQLQKRGATTILTPHPGEFTRLTEAETPADEKGRIRVAKAFAEECRCLVVLKGHRTVITDGERVAINETGNPGMATGGSGDVLTGIIVALLVQGFDPFSAVQLGVHVHGLAGDIAATSVGEVALVATDIIAALPAATKAISDARPSS